MIVIRKAKKSDAQVCARLIYSASPKKYDYWLGAFGHDPIDVLTHAFINNAGVLGYRYYWVITEHNVIVGGGLFYTHQQAEQAIRSLVWWAWRYFGIKKMPTFIKRALKLSALQQPIQEDILYVGSLGVIENKQGQGIATQLLHYQQNRAKNLGLHIGLDVATTNANAKRLYQHLGFVKKSVKQFTGGASANIPDAMRMIKNLSKIDKIDETR